MRAFLIVGLCGLAASVQGAGNLDLAPLKNWLARQGEVKTIQADFTQTRALRVLKDPVTSPGRVYFLAPDSFRWEVGDPAKTIVIRHHDTAYLIEPAKKRAQRFSAADLAQPATRRRLPLVRFPLAKSWEDFDRQFEVRGLRVDGTRCHVELLPRDPQMQQALAGLNLDFDTQSSDLLALEAKTRDGSTLRDDFIHVRADGKLDPRLFDYDLTGFEVVDAKN